MRFWGIILRNGGFPESLPGLRIETGAPGLISDKAQVDIDRLWIDFDELWIEIDKGYVDFDAV